MPKKVCFLVVLVLAVFVFPLQAQRAKDVRIVPGVATHMGQVASDHVVLHSVSIATDRYEFKRLFPDGSGDLVNDSAFVVPADKVLVVTDVSVRNINVPPEENILTQISIASLSNPPIFQSFLQLSGFGVGGTNDGMTSGFIVAPDQEIFASQDFLEFGTTGEATIILRGYLAPNE